MRIREARKKDVKNIAGLNQQLNEYHLQFDDYYRLRPGSEEITTEHMDDMVTSEDSVVLVAEDKGTIVGYIAGKIGKRPPVFELDKKGEIWEVYVSEEHRCHGVGRELTERMLRWFRQRGIEYVELSVDPRNELGCKVWKSLGFVTFQCKMKKRI